MQLTGIYTEAGAGLTAQAISGELTLTVTKVTGGSGSTLASATLLAQEQQTLAITGQTRAGADSVVEATLLAGAAAALYSLTEVGVYALNAGGDEVLYRIYRMDEPLSISPDSALSVVFYLHDLVAAGTPAEVALRTADLVSEARCKALLQAAETYQGGFLSYTCTPAELPALIDGLEQPLCHPVTVTVSAGTLEGSLKLEHLHGPGSLHISAPDGMTVTDHIRCAHCTLSQLLLTNVTCLCTAPGVTPESGNDGSAGATVLDCRRVQLKHCILGHSGGGLATYVGLYCGDSRVAADGLQILGFRTGVLAADLAQVCCYNALSGGMAGCTGAFSARRGGMIRSDQTDSLLLGGGKTGKTVASGGRILLGTQLYAPAE